MSEESWHLSKSVPLTLIFAIGMQTLALIWFVATLRNDVNNNRTDISRNTVKVESLDLVVREQSILLGRIDENLKAIKNAIERGRN